MAEELGDRIVSGADTVRARWQLTPSNARFLHAHLTLTWGISGGILALLLGGATGLALDTGEVAVAGGVPGLIAVATLAGIALLLSLFPLLLGSRRGRQLLRLRAPEPTDPGRSSLEHLSLGWLVATATLGGLVHAGGFAVVVGAGLSAFAYLLPLGVVYLVLVATRWWLPTAGTLRGDRLTVRSFPRDGQPGRGWYGQLETVATVQMASLTDVRSVTVGDVSLVALEHTDGAPVVAAVPTGVRDQLEADLRE